MAVLALLIAALADSTVPLAWAAASGDAFDCSPLPVAGALVPVGVGSPLASGDVGLPSVGLDSPPPFEPGWPSGATPGAVVVSGGLPSPPPLPACVLGCSPSFGASVGLG